MTFTEQEVEQIAVDWFRDLGYDYASGLDIAPDGAAPERKTYADVHLEGRFRSALARITPHLPAEALEDVARRVLRSERSAPDRSDMLPSNLRAVVL